MRTGKDITTIFIHCTAGYGDVASMKRFWKSLGWNSPGYHLVVKVCGDIEIVQPFSLCSNGVKGFNTNSINISYIGGVDKNNVNKAVDTRTPEQKEGLIKAIKLATDWIVSTGGTKSKLIIKGHRDASPDQNGDGVISTWERIKECPSFDAIPEYKHLTK
ncbi:N-acetylmuramoyl-L-alanine amidase [Flavobacterium sp.]